MKWLAWLKKPVPNDGALEIQAAKGLIAQFHKPGSDCRKCGATRANCTCGCQYCCACPGCTPQQVQRCLSAPM